jgi:hypothetical protein
MGKKLFCKGYPAEPVVSPEDKFLFGDLFLTPRSQWPSPLLTKLLYMSVLYLCLIAGF